MQSRCSGYFLDSRFSHVTLRSRRETSCPKFASWRTWYASECKWCRADEMSHARCRCRRHDLNPSQKPSHAEA